MIRDIKRKSRSNSVNEYSEQPRHKLRITKEPVAKSMFENLPRELLVHCLSFLRPQSLLMLSECSKFLKEIANCDQIWLEKCKILWKKKANMPFSTANSVQCCFPKIILSDSFVDNAPEDELLSILRARNISPLSGCTFAQLVKSTSPKSVFGRRWEFDAIFKASYFYSILDSKRTDISLEELCTLRWQFAFMDGSIFYVRFLPNGQAASSIPCEAEPMRFPFFIYSVIEGVRGRVKVGPFPKLEITRDLSNWAWSMSNEVVYIFSIHPGVNCSQKVFNDYFVY